MYTFNVELYYPNTKNHSEMLVLKTISDATKEFIYQTLEPIIINDRVALKGFKLIPIIEDISYQ